MPLPHNAYYALTGALQPTRKAWQLAVGSALSASGLSMSVAMPVLLVSRMGDGVLQHVLAERVGVHPAALVRQLDQAEKADLLERRVVPGNRRLRAIHLLPKGRQLADVLEAQVKALRATFLKGINRQDIETATRVLQQFEEQARRYVTQERGGGK